MPETLQPGILTVTSAYPDPPFELADGSENGFDIELMSLVCRHLKLQLSRQRYLANNFDGIFDELRKKNCDAVISGTTITPDRAKTVRFSRPYAEFNQGVAVNRRLAPNVSAPAQLRGLTAGIQSGNTSDFVARRWVTEGVIAAINYYPYDGIMTALDDLETGKVELVIKLFPVISWLIKDRPQLKVAMEVPTHEKLGIAFAIDNVELCDAVNHVLQKLENDGELAGLRSRWFPA
jgi:ABC-type amino acid transport substrate-binding protein